MTTTKALRVGRGSGRGGITSLPRDDGYQDALEWIADRALRAAIESFDAEPPSTAYERRYLKALRDVELHVRRKMVPETPLHGG